MRLSVCIATRNRAGFIGQTLESIAAQLTDEVELVVVDGASTDHTAQVMADFTARHPRTIYRRESANGGVDQDYDKAVQYASGEYCWLMGDDDIMVPGAIEAVLERLVAEPELVVVNAEVRTKDLAVVLKANQLGLEADADFSATEAEQLFAQTAGYLSFIGAVVIRRATWLSRERKAYFGSLFIHVGVIFQSPALASASVIARPLVRIRYGNALWTARGFEIWIDKWPRLVWSFGHFSEKARAWVNPAHPATSLKVLLHYRAIGAYGLAEYNALLGGGRRPCHRLARAVSVLPAQTVNALLAIYCLARRHEGAYMMLHDLANASCASATARWAARRSRFPGTER